MGALPTYLELLSVSLTAWAYCPVPAPRCYGAEGDFRMYFAENPEKVRNIVHASLGNFQDLYEPAVKVCGPRSVVSAIRSR